MAGQTVDFIQPEKIGAANGVASLDGSKKQLVGEQPDRVLTTNGARPVGKGEQVVNIRDFGSAVSPTYSVGSGGDDTLAIQAAINAVATYGGTVLVPAGTFRAVGLTCPSYVSIEGVGGHSRFGTPTLTGNRGASVIQRWGAASAVPILTIGGVGGGMRRVFLDGRGVAAPGLVMTGFENILDEVRVAYCGGIGLDVQRANNVKWRAIFIDDCGSTTEASVKFWSRDKSAIDAVANETNNVSIFGLRIERPRNVALDVALGTTAEYWVEWLRIFDLHIESSYLDTPNMNDRLVRIGNVREVIVVGFMIYCGPGGAIQHVQTINRPSGLNGGVTFDKGTILGPDLGITKNAAEQTITPVTAPAAIFLDSGTDFHVDRARFRRFGTQLFSVGATYGKYTYVALHSDDGIKTMPLPTVSAQANGATGGAILAGSDDSHGRIFFNTTAGPAAGILLEILRYHNDGRDFTITLSPKTAATAALQLYAAPSSDKSRWTLRTGNVPAASTAAATYQVEYLIAPL